MPEMWNKPANKAIPGGRVYNRGEVGVYFVSFGAEVLRNQLISKGSGSVFYQPDVRTLQCNHDRNVYLLRAA